MSERVVIDDHTVEIRRAASTASPVLMLNGAGVVAGGWADVVELLRDRTVVTVDRPGHRGTRCPDLPTLADTSRSLRRITSALGLGPMIVVAHSMAAFHAEALARLRPAAVSGIVMVDPSLVRTRPGATARAARSLAVAAARPQWWTVRQALRLPGAQTVATALAKASLRSQICRQDGFRAEHWQDMWASRETLSAGVAEWVGYERQVEELQALRQMQDTAAPVDVVVLDAPPYASPALEASTRSAFAQVQWRYVPRSRHLLMVDAPGEVVAAVESLEAGAAPDAKKGAVG